MPKTLKKVKSKKPRAKAVSVYLSDSEQDVVRRAALKQHRKVTNYIASVIVPQAERDLKAS
jgi:uncharacterized protein (DUF1778 family)